MSRKNKETPDYQLDLTPFISLLSVCICFLLLTVTWFQIGALSVKQALGGRPAANVKKEEPKQLWVYMKSGKRLEVYLKKGEKTLSRKLIPKTEEPGWDFQAFHQYITRLQKNSSNLEEVFILPTADILYENIIKVMDKLRQEKLLSIGLTPL